MEQNAITSKDDHRVALNMFSLADSGQRKRLLADQFIENIVVKGDGFAGAGAFDVLNEIGPRTVRATDRAIPDSPNDLLELLLLPGPVARLPETYQFPDEVVKAVDFGGSSTGDGLQGRNGLFYRQFL